MRHPSKILEEYQARPLKKLGQNFLVNTHSLIGIEKIFSEEDGILEIGPGLGAVTDHFNQNDLHPMVCEKDEAMVNILQQELPSVEILHRDFLELEPQYLIDKKINCIIGNLPFYITSDIIVTIMQKMPFIEKALLGVQKEVAGRILKGQGNSLALFCKALGDVSLFSNIKRTSFYPIPKVDGAWLYWQRNPKVSNIEDFSLITKAAFWGKRKTLKNSLLNNPHWQKGRGSEFRKSLLEISKDSPIQQYLHKRADELQLDDFIAILKILNDAFMGNLNSHS